MTDNCLYVVNNGCGSMTNENCTYFEVTSPPQGPCSMKVCPCSDNICQLRLDFATFQIAAPSTDSTQVTRLLNGEPSDVRPPRPPGPPPPPPRPPGTFASALPASLASRCLVDSFSVTNPGGSIPPTICGLNDNEHS